MENIIKHFDNRTDAVYMANVLSQRNGTSFYVSNEKLKGIYTVLSFNPSIFNFKVYENMSFQEINPN